MANKNILEKGGDDQGFSVSIQFLNGIYTLNNALVQELYFIEDIFSPFVSGKITFIDTAGIFEFGPITGNETITVQYTGTGEGHVTITRVFSVYKIEEISAITISETNSIVVAIHFIDSFFMDMGIRQYSRSWKKDKGHDIIKHIVTKMAKIEDKYLNTDNEAWEECNEEFENFYMPYWTCIESIKWLMKRMSSKKSENSGYLFFANGYDSDKAERNGMSTLNLTTIDTLLSNKERMKIFPTDDAVYAFEDGQLGFSENKVLSFTVDSVDKNSLKGLAGAHYYGFDNKAKRALDVDINYGDMVKKHTILGEVSLFSDISETEAGRYFTGEEDEKLIKNISYDDWVKRYIMQQYMTIVVQGHEKRYAGGLIELILPTRFKKQGPVNMTLSGGYLVKTVVHYFNPQDIVSYRQKLVCIKNGLGYNNASVLEGLLPATKKNLLETFSTKNSLGK